MPSHHMLTYGYALPNDRDDYQLRETLANGIQLYVMTSNPFPGATFTHWLAIDPGVYLGANTGMSRGTFSYNPPHGSRVGWVFDGDLEPKRDGRIWGHNYGMVQGPHAQCQTFTDWRDAISEVKPVAPLPLEGQLIIPALEAA